MEEFLNDIRNFFQLSHWNGDAFTAILRKYEATPEMFFHRLTNVIPKFFGIKDLFFIRFIHDPILDKFEIDKELHLSHKHLPHRNALKEHYCRRWVSTSLLKDLNIMQGKGKYVDTIVGAQISKFSGTPDEYFCLSLARPSYPKPDRNVSATIGFSISPELKEKIKFLKDPAIQSKVVSTTCERCDIKECQSRAAQPIIVQKKEKLKNMKTKIENLTS